VIVRPVETRFGAWAVMRQVPVELVLFGAAAALLEVVAATPDEQNARRSRGLYRRCLAPRDCCAWLAWDGGVANWRADDSDR
jgi:hypothetical protein